MWIFMNDAFLSIVTPRPNDVPKRLRGRDVLLVRARKRADLSRVFPGTRVMRTPHRDYPFRSFVPRPRVVNAVAARLIDMEYDNFKASVPNDERHDAYSKVWSVMLQYQRGAFQTPFSRQNDRSYLLWPEEQYSGN